MKDRIKRVNAKMKLKEFSGGKPGTVQAMFSVFNVIDSSGEVVRPTFFTDGQEVAMSAWGHNWGDLAVGKGIIHVTPEGAVFDGEFNLATQVGREHYETVKFMGDLQEWSFGFRVLDATPGVQDGKDVVFLEKGDVYEVSPVLIGDNRSTYTMGVKGAQDVRATLTVPGEKDPLAFPVLKRLPDGRYVLPWEDADYKKAIPYKKTETSEGSWDGGAMWKNCPAAAAPLAAACAWVDPNADENTKAAYKFIHHFVDGDGNVGAASVTACRMGIGVLNGGRGGTTIPDADREGVYNHLAKHLTDAGLKPPALKASSSDSDEYAMIEPPKGKSLAEEVEDVLADVASLSARVKSLADLRAKEGRAISAARRDQLGKIRDSLQSHAGSIDELLKETAPPEKGMSEEDVLREQARFELMKAGFIV